MASEFIKLTPPEIEYGDKNLLHSHLDLLSMMRRHQTYEELRKTELSLKVKLKKQVEEAQSAIEQFKKLLPKTKLIQEEEKEITVPEMPKSIPKKPESKKRPTLDTEVEDIRRKLASLG